MRTHISQLLVVVMMVCLGYVANAGAATLTVTADLVERFKAEEIVGLSDNDVVTTWSDIALGDATAQDGTSVGDPRFFSNITPSGKAVVRFDGDTDGFSTTPGPGIGATSGFAYFAVVKANATLDNGTTSDGSGDYIFDRTGGNPLVGLKAVGGTYGYQTRYDDGTGLGGPVSSTSISTAEFQIVALRRNTVGNQFEIWVDGLLEGTLADPGTALTPDPIFIGRHGTIAAGGLNGDIAELLIYSSELSDADFQSVGVYLETEYGLDTAFAVPPVPEPSTLLVLGLGVVCLVRCTRSRNKR